jgi:Ca2+-binding EF-hand superfamily protein
MSKLINHLTNETYKVFEELDDDTDGNLNFEDFKKLTQNQNFKECSESYLKKIYAKADVNNDSKISFDEFCDMVYELTLSDDEDDDEYENKTEDETDDDLGDSNKYQAYKVKKQLSTLKE